MFPYPLPTHSVQEGSKASGQHPPTTLSLPQGSQLCPAFLLLNMGENRSLGPPGVCILGLHPPSLSIF